MKIHFQLPHMPHISECLMKRNLKPADLRDMTIGQLQVIVNDLHSQIESKWSLFNYPLASTVYFRIYIFYVCKNTDKCTGMEP